MKKSFSILTLLLVLLSSQWLFGQYTQPKTRILFVFDASQSMYASWQTGSKMDVAQRLMSEMLDSLERVPNQNFELALRVYGHQKPVPPQDCDDTKLEIPFGPGNIPRIKKRLQAIKPMGTTPIARSLQRAAGDFPSCADCRNIIILITDGVEACDEDPCAVSRMLQERGIILKPFVIGIGLDENFRSSFECVGTYFDATNEQSFETILGIVISQALNNTTAQVNLLDIKGLPTETNVNMTFYDELNGFIRYNYIHTINHRGNPDTLILDPLITYRLVVHTTPPVEKTGIQIIPGTHNVIALDAPQGTLELKVSGLSPNKELKCIVRKAGYERTLNVQDFNKMHKYIVGKYDLEILTLPRYYENNVKIDQSTNTKIEIPAPGLASISMKMAGFGSIFVERNNQLEWVVNLPETGTNHNIYLQPGQYRIVFRPASSKQSLYTIEKKFNITSGGSTAVNLNN